MFSLHDPLSADVRDELKAYDDLTASLLARRGVLTKEAAEHFLHPSYETQLHDPLLMTDMRKAAQRVITAIREKESFAVWSDYDCDGIPGAVLLSDFFSRAESNARVYIPHRHDEGYGLSITGIEKLAREGVTLILTVDSGITDTKAVTRANELGIDVIITDHHLPGEVLPDAYAVVNPNARATEPYPFHGLCGTGVAWKLVTAILQLSPEIRARVPQGSEKWLLDMVGLATIADMVPLTGENRVLAHYGLLVLRKSPRIGFQKLCRTVRVDQRTLDEGDIGFMIAPRINAASRLGDPYDAFTLFSTQDAAEADRLAKELEKLNRARKAQAGAITRSVHARLAERGVLRSVIALGDPDWRPALLGLVANVIAEEFERPVFLWGREGSGALKGSVRSGGSVHALSLMQAAEEVFEGFGGHAASGGFTVKDDAVFFLEDRLVEAREKLASANAVETELSQADAPLTLSDVSRKTLRALESLSPYGMQNPKPVFLFADVVVDSIARFGKGGEHVKVTLGSTDGNTTLEAVTFFVKGNLARTLDALTRGAHVSILAHIEKETFSRVHSVRLRLLELHKV